MPEDHSEAAASWSMDSLEITDAFGRIVPISLRYNTGFMDAAVRASVRDRVTFFWRFEDDPLMGAGGPAPEMEAGLAEMEARRWPYHERPFWGRRGAHVVGLASPL